MEKTEIFICECGSLEHTYAFWYDEDFNDVHFMPHLRQHRNFFKRIGVAIKYIFGYKSRYGDFDSVIINPDDIKKIKRYFDMSETFIFLEQNPKILEMGIDTFGNKKELNEWLLSTTPYSKANGGRVIDMKPEEIINEIGRIEHGIY